MFSWTELIVFALIATWTPGPNPITSMGNASAFGFKETVPFWMGIYPAFFILMLLAAFLSKGLMEIVPSLQKIMVFLGALYIFYLAYKMLRRNPHDTDFETEKVGMKDGFLLQFINPKVLLYCLTAMNSYVLPYYDGRSQLIGFSFFLVTLAMMGNLLWGLAGSLFQKYYKKYYQKMNLILSLLLFYFGVKLILSFFQ